MGVFILYLYIHTYSWNRPTFSAFKYMLVSLIVHLNLSVRSGFNTTDLCVIILDFNIIYERFTNIRIDIRTSNIDVGIMREYMS